MLSSTIYFFHRFTNNESKTKKEMAHHVVSSNFFSMNEIVIANKIRKLNTKPSFRFYIFDKAERLKIGEIGSYNLDANIIKSNAQKILLTFVKRNLVYFDSYLLSLSSFKIYIYLLIEGYRYLLASINLLVSNDLIHNGLDLDSIVALNGIPILTNFIFTVDLQKNDFNWQEYFLQRKLTKFCPVEFYLLQYQLTNNQVLSLYNIETIIKQFVKDNNLVTDLSLSYFAKYANKTFDQNLAEALKYCKTWDNYALSMVYLDILQNMLDKRDNKFISNFMKLLVDNICLDPSKRSLPDKCLHSFEDMLQTISISDFRELLV